MLQLERNLGDNITDVGNCMMGKQARAEWLRARAGHKGKACLLWPFSKIWNGYGNLKYGNKVTYAHRVMCEFAHGPAPSKRHQAAHSCGNGGKGCVNPTHLSWKTPRQNQLDRRKHGTSGRRTVWSRTNHKVTDKQKRRIIALKGKKNQREIGAMFGLSYQHVSLIQRGLSRQPRAAG